MHLRPQLNLSSSVLNAIEVLNEFGIITHKSCPDPDMIPSILFINCKFVLTVLLLYLFNPSLSTVVFPTLWKLSHVTPNSISIDLISTPNYQSICLLSTIPKMSESIVSKNNSVAFSIDQHGFRRRGKTTATNQLVFQKCILNAFASGSQIDAISQNFQKLLIR